MSTCFLDGVFQPLDGARVSVLDRGFIFGDGVYEVLPVYAGRPFCLEEHLERLSASLAAIRLEPPLSTAQWRSVVAQLVQSNGGGDLSVYLQVTRGPAFPRDHLFPAAPAPTVFAMATPLVRKPPAPVTAISLPDIRWQRCHIKATALLANVLLRQQAADAGAYEALLLRDGLLTEGAASNVFLVSDGRVCTPPKGPHLLGGITRDVVIRTLAGTRLAVAEVELNEATVRAAEEIWLTSSTREILPVVQLDGRPVGSGEPGPCWREALERYQAFRDASPGVAPQA